MRKPVRTLRSGPAAAQAALDATLYLHMVHALVMQPSRVCAILDGITSGLSLFIAEASRADDGIPNRAWVRQYNAWVRRAWGLPDG